MLVAIGRYLRKLRIDRGELLKDMSDKLDVTASYLSAVENGKRNFPSEWETQIIEHYHLNEVEQIDLRNAITESAESVKIELKNVNGSRKNFAFALARKFDSLDDDKIEQIKKILESNA